MPHQETTGPSVAEKIGNKPNIKTTGSNMKMRRSPSTTSRTKSRLSTQLSNTEKSKPNVSGTGSSQEFSSPILQLSPEGVHRRLSAGTVQNDRQILEALSSHSHKSKASLQPSPTSRESIPLSAIKSLPAQNDEANNQLPTHPSARGMSLQEGLKPHMLQSIQTAHSTTSSTSPHKKRKGVRLPVIEDPTVSLLQTVNDTNTLDIWLHKKGGDFDIFDGKLVVQPGNYNSKKDFITVKRVTERNRKNHIPELNWLEKINGDIYDFSTNKKHLKHAVDVWLPCHPITHPHLQEIKLKAKYKGEEEWVYHQWTLYGDDPQYPVMEFTADRLGTFVATVQPRVERVTVTDQGLLYNARINRYISLRFPKKCVDRDTNIEIRILPFNMEKALMVKEDFRSNYPDLNDFELSTDYFDITADMSSFRRMVSVKIPTSVDGFNEENRDEIIIMRKDMETDQWCVVESNLKITRTTVAFDTRTLGRFVVLKAPAKRKLRMKNALPVLETKMSKCRREILIFKKLLKKSWNIWVELVKPSQVTSVIRKRESDGIVCISKPEYISTDLDGKPEYAFPVLAQLPPPENTLVLTDSDVEFTKDMGVNGTDSNHTDLFINIYDADPDENNNNNPSIKAAASRKLSRAKSLKREYDYIEIDDSADCGLVEVHGNIQAVEDTPLRPFFLEYHQDNFMTFEIEPRDVDLEGDIEAVLKYHVENIGAADGLITKTMIRECNFTITAEQVADYFWVEPEPEPIIEEVKKEIELSPESVVEKEILTLKESAKLTADKVKDQADTVLRLSAPSRPKKMIYREPRVLSGRSLQTLSRLIEEGLTLAVYLDMPDSTITGIGFDALSNGLSLGDVTYRILLRWKRSTRSKGESAVEQLINALRGLGRHDIVSIVQERHRRNSELTPSCFADLHADDDADDLRDQHLGNVVPLKEFTF